MIYTVIFIILLLSIIVIILIRWRKLKPYNQSPLKIDTFDGLDSPFHPSVLYFANGWNGWKYWMVETPFSPKCKPYVDRNECPSIHVSNDGINWRTPDGLINPLVNFGIEGENNLDYYSDPHLVMVGNKMECWYRLTERHGNVDNRDHVSLRKVYTEDGIHWSKENIIKQLWKGQDGIGLGKMVVSPALIYSNENGYTMWFVNSEDHKGKREVSISYSKDGINWDDAKICCLHGESINPWHIDVIKDNNGTFLMTVYDKNDLTLWQSNDGLNWLYICELLNPSGTIGSFYSNGLYRSCLVQDNEIYKLFFSAYDYYNTYIGIGSFKTPGDNLNIFKGRKNHSFCNFFIYAIMEEYRHIKFIISHFYKSRLIR